MEEELSGMDGNHGDVESRYRQEFARERATRERLERQLNEIATENRRRREETEEAERVSVIREGLEERGVKKTRLALRLVKDDVKRGDDGRLYGEADGGDCPRRLPEHFVRKSEFASKLPADPGRQDSVAGAFAVRI
jgi:hypothetical protein